MRIKSFRQWLKDGTKAICTLIELRGLFEVVFSPLWIFINPILMIILFPIQLLHGFYLIFHVAPRKEKDDG